MTLFGPSGDSDTYSAAPITNYGMATVLRLQADNGGQRRSYLKFDVQGLTRPIASVSLIVRTKVGAVQGASAFAVTNGWTETGITWFNQPLANGTPLATSGPSAVGETATFDVTSAILGNGTYSFAIVGAAGDTASFAAREAFASDRPELRITFR
jgi:hypothetical protein